MRFTIFLLVLVLASKAWSACLDIEVQPSKVRQGGLFLVTITGPSRAKNLRCEFAGNVFQSFPSPILGTDRVIVGCSWDTNIGPQLLYVSGKDCFGNPFKKEMTVEVIDGKFRQERLRVAKKMAKPPEHLLQRIRNENRLLKTTLSQESECKLEGAFLRPIPGIVVSPFGSKRVFNGQVKSRHTGVDLRGGMGRPIKAINSGNVVLARSLYYAGTTVVIDHGLGLFSLYAHLKELDVDEGEFVEKGQVLGRVGATGRVTGPHLHWGLKLKGMTVNPLDCLEIPLIPSVTDGGFVAAAL